jgi:serine phosphatase RsbU (regulator of sigma subunit)
VIGQLRTGWRAYSLQQFPVSVLMRSLDLLLQDLSDTMLATAVCVVADPMRREIEIISAGHPPPLVVDADGTATFVSSDPHTPLGVQPSPIYLSTVVQVPPGSLLVMYTDGLVEGRDVSLDEGMAHLASVTSAAVDQHVGTLCDTVLEKIVGDGQGDDVALLAVRFSV